MELVENGVKYVGMAAALHNPTSTIKPPQKRKKIPMTRLLNRCWFHINTLFRDVGKRIYLHDMINDLLAWHFAVTIHDLASD